MRVSLRPRVAQFGEGERCVALVAFSAEGGGCAWSGVADVKVGDEIRASCAVESPLSACETLTAIRLAAARAPRAAQPPKPQYRFAFRSLLVTTVRFKHPIRVRSTVPTRLVAVTRAPQNTLHRTLEPRHQSQPLSNTRAL